jgi:phosphonatase-like hydrolase
MKPAFVAFDVAGTTMQDDGVVIAAFESAFSEAFPEQWAEHHEEWLAYVIETMGQSKIEVFTHLLKNRQLAVQANEAFEVAYSKVIETDGAEAIEGVEDVFRKLQAEGIPVVLTTGFSRPTLDAILESLGWWDLIDLSITPGEAGMGRPHPDMLNLAAQKLGVADPSSVVVLGDTQSDMKAGLAFGAERVYGVLTGCHDGEQLDAAGATAVIYSAADLFSLIGN